MNLTYKTTTDEISRATKESLFKALIDGGCDVSHHGVRATKAQLVCHANAVVRRLREEHVMAEAEAEAERLGQVIAERGRPEIAEAMAAILKSLASWDRDLVAEIKAFQDQVAKSIADCRTAITWKLEGAVQAIATLDRVRFCEAQVMMISEQRITSDEILEYLDYGHSDALRFCMGDNFDGRSTSPAHNIETTKQFRARQLEAAYWDTIARMFREVLAGEARPARLEEAHRWVR
ncbi:MAG: hypothetical protein WC378_00240 [Opitutaceae bacterium]|jgi:hypothetical protein